MRHWITSFLLFNRDAQNTLRLADSKDLFEADDQAAMGRALSMDPGDFDAGATGWIGQGRVRARETASALLLTCDGLTTQAKYYKPLFYEFFRKEWRGARPGWGDHSVEIAMHHVGEPPLLDLDNLAKALLDAIKGYAFHDDSQVARLLVERCEGPRERVMIRVTRHRPDPG
jgi:hypothetical protein